MTTRRVRLEYSIASVIVSLILSGIFGSWYMSTKIEDNANQIRAEELKRVQERHKSDLALCNLIEAITQIPPDPSVPPPVTEFGKQLAASQALVQRRLLDLRETLRCPNSS
jgi:hypothetical protein